MAHLNMGSDRLKMLDGGDPGGAVHEDAASVVDLQTTTSTTTSEVAATPKQEIGAATALTVLIARPPHPSTCAISIDNYIPSPPTQRPSFAAAVSRTASDFLQAERGYRQQTKHTLLRRAAQFIDNISKPLRSKRRFDAIDDDIILFQTVASHERQRPPKRSRTRLESDNARSIEDWRRAVIRLPIHKEPENTEKRKEAGVTLFTRASKRKAEEDPNKDTKRFRIGSLRRFLPRLALAEHITWKVSLSLHSGTPRPGLDLLDCYLSWALPLKGGSLYKHFDRLHGLSPVSCKHDKLEIATSRPAGTSPKLEEWEVTLGSDRMDISPPQPRTAIAQIHHKTDFSSFPHRLRGDDNREMQGTPWTARVLARGQESAMYYDRTRMEDTRAGQNRLREQTRVFTSPRNDDIARARQARHEEKIAAMARVVSDRGQGSMADRKENDERLARKKKLAGKWFGVNRGARQDGYKTTQTLYGEEITIRLGELHFARREEESRSKLQKDLQLPDGLRRQKIRRDRLVVKLSEEWEGRVDKTLAIRDASQTVASSTDGVSISRKDIGRIIPGEPWLNDEVVNAWYSNLVTKLNLLDGYDKTDKKKAAGQIPRWAAYNSQWYTNATSAKGVRSIKTWSRRKGIEGARILNSERIFFPTNTGVHWTLLSISGRSRTIEYLDSMNREGFNAKVPIGLAKSWLSMELGEDYKESEWKILRTSSSQQNNSNDCGVFACFNGLALAAGVTDPSDEFGAADMPSARRQMVATLLNGSFNDGMYSETFLDTPKHGV